MRIAIAGADGQLGSKLVQRLRGNDVLPLTHAEIEIRDPASVDRALDAAAPDLLINATAMNVVDRCEEQIADAFAVNSEGVAYLARAAERRGAVFVHFSTDYVFGGEQRTPYRETDCPCPQSVYAMSKLAGELMARRYASRHFVIRTCGLFGIGGSKNKGTNFVDTMIRLAGSGKKPRVVSDQVVAPTSVVDLADAVAQLITTNKFGLYHITNAGQCSWYEFARAIFERVANPDDLTPVSSADYGSVATRPQYSILSNERLAEAGVPPLRHWREAVAAYLDERLGSRSASQQL